jgi:hypothetical protein
MSHRAKGRPFARCHSGITSIFSDYFLLVWQSPAWMISAHRFLSKVCLYLAIAFDFFGAVLDLDVRLVSL